MDNYGILSLAPALIAVILAFITREALFSILCGVLVGLLITGQDLLFGFTGLIQSALGNADYIWVIGIEVFIGIMVAFFQKSGAIEAVANKLNEKLHITPRIAQIMGAALGVLVFFSDYFSPLFVGNVMRPITDKAKVSREKLAWLCDCTSAPVCITLPFTAWGVYVAGLVVGFGTFATADAGQAAVIHLGEATDILVKPKVGMVVPFGDGGANVAGGARGAEIVALQTAFRDVRDYMRNKAAYDRAGVRDLALSKADLEALIPVIEGRMPIIAVVQKASDIRAVLKFAREEKIKVILSGAEEGWMAAREIAAAGVPVILDPLSSRPQKPPQPAM